MGRSRETVFYGFEIESLQELLSLLHIEAIYGRSAYIQGMIMVIHSAGRFPPSPAYLVPDSFMKIVYYARIDIAHNHESKCNFWFSSKQID